MKRSDELKEAQYKVYVAQKEIAETAKKEGRTFNDEENQKWDKAEKDYSDYERQINQAVALEERESKFAQVNQETAEKAGLSVEERNVRVNKAWANYLIQGERLSPEDTAILRGTSTQSTVDALGGYTIPQGFSNKLEIALKEYGGMMDIATIFRTSKGDIIDYPTVNDTTVTGALMTEGTAPAVSDMAFGNVTLNAHLYSSLIVKITLQLAQDTAFDLEGFLAGQLGTRLGRIMNTHFTTGDNSSKPQGAVNGSVVGKLGALGAITVDDFYDLESSVDPMYRKGNKVAYMFNDATLTAIKKLSVGSSDDRPLWQNGFAFGAPNTVNGYKYVINQDMASIGSGNKPILFGDFSKYVVRMVQNPSLVVMRERFIDALSIGYISHVRADGRYVTAASSNPVKHFRNATT
jgi:HK97 family phage major capsid protein